MIGIINCGSGNIQAIQNIYKRLNIETCIIHKPKDFESIKKIIVPGVGAYDEIMSSLNNSGIREALDFNVLKKKLPTLGVCVGMQIMGTSSEEGSLPGLNWIPGDVRKFNEEMIEHLPKIPHMGWNEISESNNRILHGVDFKKGFYFLHSYYFVPKSSADSLSKTFYGYEFTNSISKDNIYGFQFHPEKSHSNGVTLFKNFASL